MTNQALQQLIGSWLPDLEFTEEETQFLNIQVQAEHLHNLMSRLKSDPETQFDYLFCLSGVDWGEELGMSITWSPQLKDTS